MISVVRVLGWAAGCATLLIAGMWVEPAGAQVGACKADAVTASGRAKFRPLTKEKELDGRGSAMADAVANWQRKVAARFGEQWQTWSKAKGTRFECAPTEPGKVIAGNLIGCTISGRPCSTATSATPKSAAVVNGDRRREQERTRDRDRRGRRERERSRDGEERRDRTNSAYEREMEHQERLAAERDKARMEAYEREMEHQRRLEEQRRRAEGR